MQELSQTAHNLILARGTDYWARASMLLDLSSRDRPSVTVSQLTDWMRKGGESMGEGVTSSLLRQANNESWEVFDIIKPGRRIKIKVTGSKVSITSDDSLFACGNTFKQD